MKKQKVKQNPQLENTAIKQKPLTIEEEINFQKFRLAITQKSVKEILQHNQLMEQVISQLGSKISPIQAENSKYLEIISESESFFKRMQQQNKSQDQLCERLIPRLEVKEKNTNHIKELKNQRERCSSQQKLTQQKLQMQKKFCLQAESILEQKENQLNQSKKESDWQDRQIHRLYKLLNQYESQNEEMFVLRKKFNNDLQELKGNIRVYCRIRPPKKGGSAISVTSDNTLKITYEKQRNNAEPEKFEQGYIFEQIFSESETQQEVFTQLSQLIQNSIDGKNVCIFAYGQTGSGKTYTLLGLGEEQADKRRVYEERGLASRSIELIFKQIQHSRRYKWQYKAFLSIQEIYLQNIIDLIAKANTVKDRCTEVQVTEAQEVLAYMKESSYNRKMAATNMNQRSSRSHLIITIRLEGHSEKNDEKRKGSLVFIDLAGSQRLKQSKVQGQLLKETQFINKSLSSLGTVINQMRKDSQHISFRNSKLTHVLQRYLQGDSKTLMFVNVSPDPEDVSQTKLSLSFAQGVRQVKVKK